jgi:hypothetical protein
LHDPATAALPGHDCGRLGILAEAAARWRQHLRDLHSIGIVPWLTRRTQFLLPRGLPPMSVNTKRVFYVKYLSHGIFAELLGARPDVRLDRLDNDSAEQGVAPILAAARFERTFGFAPGQPERQLAGE